jgi:holo-[acyl-carrier protein] synthase
VRVGVDLVSVETVRGALATHGERYLRRIYTDAEVGYCLSAAHAAPERLAARFAAKEAALKVLRPAGTAIPWRDIEVVRQPHGWVELSLSGRAAAAAREEGLGELALSISHEAGYATAVVAAARTASVSAAQDAQGGSSVPGEVG